MRRVAVLFFCLVFSVAFLGCASNKSKIAEGSVVGGVLGAGAGAIIGSVAGGHTGAGAGIGAAVGAIAGGAIGSQIPKEGKPAETATSAPVNAQQMSIQQIVDMAKQGLSDSVIIDKIRYTNSKFVFTDADIKYLKGQGLSQKVIDAMQGK